MCFWIQSVSIIVKLCRKMSMSECRMITSDILPNVCDEQKLMEAKEHLIAEN